VPPRRREVELTVERPVGGSGPSGGVARLSARLEPGPDGTGPTPVELREAYERLVADLDAVVGVPLAGGPAADRDVAELIDTYRPRQRELVDLLLSDGEISPSEHARLVEHLADALRPRPARSVAPPVVDRPIAAAPIAAEPSAAPTRPVEELLKNYQIASLKQAGAVRARRQISFAEYMALKRHFESAGAPTAAPGS
jgi:hypothetical protein